MTNLYMCHPLLKGSKHNWLLSCAIARLAVNGTGSLGFPDDVSACHCQKFLVILLNKLIEFCFALKCIPKKIPPMIMS